MSGWMKKLALHYENMKNLYPNRMETENLFGTAVRKTNLGSRNVKNAIMLDGHLQ